MSIFLWEVLERTNKDRSVVCENRDTPHVHSFGWCKCSGLGYHPIIPVASWLQSSFLAIRVQSEVGNRRSDIYSSLSLHRHRLVHQQMCATIGHDISVAEVEAQGLTENEQ